MTGLSASAAAARLAEDGPNEPLVHERQGVLRRVLSRFVNPLVAILLVAAAAAAFLGDVMNALIITLVVALSAVVEGVQTRRSENAALALRARVAPSACALRDGAFVHVPRREIVRGDVVRLAAGDMVPADARLVESKDLHLHEAALTGESLPVEKSAQAEDPAARAIFMGTSVVSGTAKAEVVATGPATRFGALAKALAARPTTTAFDRGIAEFGAFIMRTVVFLILFVVVASAARHQPPLESVLFAVALAVGLTPEFLPMITSVTLARGAVRMARRKVIVKNLAAIQNLGSIDVLCSDKTGTLTLGTLELERALDGLGEETTRPLDFAGLCSAFETGIDNPLDEATLRRLGMKPVESGELTMTWGSTPLHFEKLDEVPFDFERRRMSVLVRRHKAEGFERWLVCKGGPESVLGACTHVERGGVAVALDEELSARCAATARELGRRGFRVLAVCWRECPDGGGVAGDEHDMTLAGFLAFADPPREDAADVILLEHDLRVMMAGVIEGRAAFGNVMKYLLMGTSSAFGNMFSMAGASAFLPFLPMLPTQILLNNFLYDLAQVTIPTDKVDESFVQKPRRWDIGLVRRFMIYVGPISSVFDFLTFYVMLRVFRASPELFRTGWFVESLATQTLVIFVIRTFGNPLRSRPSRALAITTLVIVALGVALPVSPLGPWLGFCHLPASYYAFLAAAVVTYLALVEITKRLLFARAVK
jgi:magnesium-transporting ATPase (P-type)